MRKSICLDRLEIVAYDCRVLAVGRGVVPDYVWGHELISGKILEMSFSSLLGLLDGRYQ
jgi:hypothetical protein